MQTLGGTKRNRNCKNITIQEMCLILSKSNYKQAEVVQANKSYIIILIISSKYH